MQAAGRFPQMVEGMPPQRRAGIDPEGMAPRPDQKPRFDRLNQSHGRLAGYRAGRNGWRCCREEPVFGDEAGASRTRSAPKMTPDLVRLWPRALLRWWPRWALNNSSIFPKIYGERFVKPQAVGLGHNRAVH